MENQQGWIKLHRKVYKNPRSNDPEWLAVWVYLLTHVAWEPTDVILEGKRITIQAGQIATGRRYIARQTGVHASKVERVLTCLEIEQQIEQQTTPHCRLITIKNWSQYQQSEPQNEPQLNHNRTTTEPQLNHIKEFKEDKEIKEIKKESGEASSPTPSETMKDFILSVTEKNERYLKLVETIGLRWKIPVEKVSAEVDKFLNYWCELTPSGKKQRWQTEKTFEVQRRLVTWFSNANKFSNKTTPSIANIR